MSLDSLCRDSYLTSISICQKNDLSLNNLFLKGEGMSQLKQTMLVSVSVYLAWVTATYILEGRILTLLRPEAVFERIAYTVVANFLIGIIVGVWVLRSFLRSGVVTLKQSGFNSIHHTVVAVVVAGVIGFILLMVLNPPSLNPIIILNIYAQVLTVSIAEIIVCWGVIGVSFEAVTRTKGRVVSMLIGILSADFLFGIYHFAHSPPFNQIGMVLFLMVIGLFTSLIYFIGRNIYATIVFHNFFGVLGVMQALEKSGNLSAYDQPLLPILTMAFLSVIILICSEIFVVRRVDESG